MKNRYFEILKIILDSKTKEEIQRSQKYIAVFLNLAKDDFFWKTVETIRLIMKDYYFYLPFDDPRELWGSLFKPFKIKPELHISIKKFYKRIIKEYLPLAKKKERTQEERGKILESSIFDRLYTLIKTKSRFMPLTMIESLVSFFYFPTRKSLSFIEHYIIVLFVILDVEYITDIWFYIVMRLDTQLFILSDKYRTCLLLKDGHIYLEIFNDTSPKMLREALVKEKILLKYITKAKQENLIPNFSVLKRFNSRFYEKLLVEYESYYGNNCGKIYREKISDVDLKSDEQLNDKEFENKYNSIREKREINRLRRLKYRLKNKWTPLTSR